MCKYTVCYIARSNGATQKNQKTGRRRQKRQTTQPTSGQGNQPHQPTYESSPGQQFLALAAELVGTVALSRASSITLIKVCECDLTAPKPVDLFFFSFPFYLFLFEKKSLSLLFDFNIQFFSHYLRGNTTNKRRTGKR